MKVKDAGGALMFIGFGSIVLHLIGYEFRILGWIDTWGPSIAWAIRGGIAILGVILFVVGLKQAGETPTTSN